MATDTFIFVYGIIATLLVTGAIGMIFWAAVEDGKVLRDKKEIMSDSSAASSSQPAKSR